MADKIRGITIEIGGDTSGLTKSLKGVNSEITSTQKQLKDVERLLKLDPGNVELLKQKHQLLTKEVEQTNDKLKELKNIQDKMDANGVDKNSEQYQALQREIIATENSLKDLQSAADQSNVVLQKIGTTAQKVADGANKVADATRGMSAAAAAAIVALGKAGYDSVVLADDLNTLAKQTGFTTEELQKMNYAADLIDVSTEDITASMKKLKKNLTSTSKEVQAAFKELGVSVKDASGEYRNASDIYWDVVDALGKVTNETERDTLAMTILGKSADSLAGIVDDGGQAFRELGEQAAAAGLILSQDTLDSLNVVNDEIDTLKANAKATLAESGAKAIEALLPAIEKVVLAIADVLTWLGSLDTEQVQTLFTILAIVAAISPIASIIGGIASAITALIPIIAAITAFCAANPIVLAIAAIVIAVTGLIILITTYWEEISSFIESIPEWFYSTLIEPVVNLFTAMFNKIKETWISIINSIINLGKGLINGMIGLVENGVNALISKINTVINAFNSVVSAVARAVGLTYGGISTLKSIRIPKLAKGGILSSGTALVGEAGPELLTMIGGKAQVTPLTANLSDKAISAISGTGKNVTNVNVEFTGSLAQLASVLHPYITAETGRIGNKLIKA